MAGSPGVLCRTPSGQSGGVRAVTEVLKDLLRFFQDWFFWVSMLVVPACYALAYWPMIADTLDSRCLDLTTVEACIADALDHPDPIPRREAKSTTDPRPDTPLAPATDAPPSILFNTVAWSTVKEQQP